MVRPAFMAATRHRSTRGCNSWPARTTLGHGHSDESSGAYILRFFCFRMTHTLSHRLIPLLCASRVCATRLTLRPTVTYIALATQACVATCASTGDSNTWGIAFDTFTDCDTTPALLQQTFNLAFRQGLETSLVRQPPPRWGSGFGEGTSGFVAGAPF